MNRPVKAMTGRDWLTVGIDLNRQRKFADALPIFEHAIAQCQEDLLAAACNRAVALGELGRADEALAILDGILAQRPEFEMARLNRGIVRMQVGRLEDAILDYRMIVDHPELSRAARFGLGFANLVMGNLREGFEGFECRKLPPTPVPPQPEWTGQPLAGKSILVLGEMGLGDNIMFLRYAPMLRARGAENVFVAVPPPMKPLAECMEGITALSSGKPRFDYWVRMMSLAHRFGTDIDSVPPPAKFNLPPALRDAWTLPMRSDRIKVGLCWSGSRESEYDSHRNVPLAALAPVVELPGIDFYSLQIDVRDSDRAAFDAADIFDVGAKLKHFRDTACVVSALDLVITVDTSVAHLAGSLGVPTWVMLTSFRTYWLWIRDRDDCPWYPQTRAFRQTKDGDWADVVQRVRESLRSIPART